jgi:hypothetical protein
MGASDVMELQQPVKNERDIRSVNFFNGRLLSSKDLTREQAARRESDWRLGLALGDGVAFGLQVATDPDHNKDDEPVVKIKAGLAINRKGQALRLIADASVALKRSFSAASANCLFTECERIAAGIYVRGAGVYVLTIAPAELSEGKAPTNGLDPTNVRCNTDATVEAVQFRLIALDRADYASATPGTSKFRNELAYLCFGAGVQASWFASLLDATARTDDLLDLAHKRGLTDFDVPLALLYITGAAKLTFTDLWAVRRPLSRVSADQWSSLVDARRQALGYAMFMQFQRQIMDAAPPSGDLGTLTARGDFHFLPPVGVIPVPEETDKTDAKATRFFKDMTYRGPAFINAARLEGLVRESLAYPPIDTQDAEMIWLYRVRENRMAFDFAGTGKRPRSYLVFASGHLPYRADAQFDLAYWNYSNFAVQP